VLVDAWTHDIYHKQAILDTLQDMIHEEIGMLDMENQVITYHDLGYRDEAKSVLYHIHRSGPPEAEMTPRAVLVQCKAQRRYDETIAYVVVNRVRPRRSDRPHTRDIPYQ
jgi:hypothetical protein